MMHQSLCRGRAIVGLCLLVLVAGNVNPTVGAEPTQKNSSPIPELRISLRNAMQVAVVQNPTVQLSREQIKESEANSFTQLGALLPNLSGDVSAANRKFFLGNFGGQSAVSDNTDFYGTRAFLTQSLFSMSLIQRWRASKTGIEVATFDFETTKQDTMATVALIYLEAISFEAAVKARQADVKLNRELLRLAAERKSAGMATSLDVTRAQVQLQSEKQRLLVAKMETARAKLNLIRAIGLPFTTNIVLIDELKIVEVDPQTPEEAIMIAKENRMELKAQARRERVAALTLSSIKGERIPSLTGSGDVGLVGNQVPDAVTTHNVEILMSVPIFDGGQREGRISESRSQVLQESIRTRDLYFQVSLEVRDALLTLESAQEEVAVSKEGLRQSLKELDLARERFAVGVATNIEITNAQTSVAQSRDSVIKSLFNFNAARVNLARSQGRLEEL